MWAEWGTEEDTAMRVSVEHGADSGRQQWEPVWTGWGIQVETAMRVSVNWVGPAGDICESECEWYVAYRRRQLWELVWTGWSRQEVKAMEVSVNSAGVGGGDSHES